jgi:uncharacterized protein YndB with AHSA1/START domain
VWNHRLADSAGLGDEVTNQPLAAAPRVGIPRAVKATRRNGVTPMSANVMVVAERQFDYLRPVVFRAWAEPGEPSQWRGCPGWHVEAGTAAADNRLGGRHHHVKVRDNDPPTRVTTDGVYTEYFDQDVFVSSEHITGDPGIDPEVPLELRVECTKYGKDGTLVRIIQGPYDPDVAGWHGEGWEKELTRLHDFLEARCGGTR